MKFFEIGYLDNENRRCLINTAHLISVEMKESNHGGYNIIIHTVGEADSSKRIVNYSTMQDAENAYAAVQHAIMDKDPEKAML